MFAAEVDDLSEIASFPEPARAMAMVACTAHALTEHHRVEHVVATLRQVSTTTAEVVEIARRALTQVGLTELCDAAEALLMESDEASWQRMRTDQPRLEAALGQFTMRHLQSLVPPPGATTDAWDDRYECTACPELGFVAWEALFWQIFEQDLQWLVEALLDLGLDPNFNFVYGNPLVFAFRHDNCSSMVEMLLRRGALPNPDNEHRSAALLDAVSNHDHDSIQLLLDHGADIDAPYPEGTNDGVTPLLHAIAHRPSSGPNATADMLVNAGADPSLCDDHGANALHHAAHARDEDLLATMLARGAAIDDLGSRGFSALWGLVDREDEHGVDVLLRHGASVDLPDRRHGSAPLMRACERGNHAIVARLLAHHADVHLTNLSGETALHVAIAAAAPVAVITALVAAGATRWPATHQDCKRGGRTFARGSTPDDYARQVDRRELLDLLDLS